MHDLGIDHGRVGFDDEGFGRRLGLENVEIADGYDPLMHARAVKTRPSWSCSRGPRASTKRPSGAPSLVGKRAGRDRT